MLLCKMMIVKTLMGTTNLDSWQPFQLLLSTAGCSIPGVQAPSEMRNQIPNCLWSPLDFRGQIGLGESVTSLHLDEE